MTLFSWTQFSHNFHGQKRTSFNFINNKFGGVNTKLIGKNNTSYKLPSLIPIKSFSTKKISKNETEEGLKKKIKNLFLFQDLKLIFKKYIN